MASVTGDFRFVSQTEQAIHSGISERHSTRMLISRFQKRPSDRDAISRARAAALLPDKPMTFFKGVFLSALRCPPQVASLIADGILRALVDLEEARRRRPASHVALMIYAQALRSRSGELAESKGALEQVKMALNLLECVKVYLGPQCLGPAILYNPFGWWDRQVGPPKWGI